VTVNGTSTIDTITVQKSGTTTVQVNALKTVTLPAASDEDVTIAAGDGEDTINVSGSTSGAQIINVDGGIPTANAVASDRLTIIMSTAGTTGVVPGSTPDSGAVTSPDGQTNFSGIEFVVVTGTVAGANTLNAQGTNAPDSFALQFLNAANRFWVNDRAVVTFSNYQTVNLNGMFGDDTFSISSSALVGVTTINVGGGDPTASDTVVVNGTTAADTITYSPTAADAGNITGLGPTINLATVENITINGQGSGDTLVVNTPAGQDHITFTPGVDATQGSVSFRVNNGGPLLPMNYAGFDSLSTLRFSDAGGGRADVLNYQGTTSDDRFDFVGTGTVRILGPAAFIAPRRTLDTNLPGVSLLRLIGFFG